MISIIVPIYNEEKTIVKFQNQFNGLTGNYEIVFSDGGSSDETLSLIEKRYKVMLSPKGRAKQMNFAAKQCKGDILLFLHCDSLIDEKIISSVNSAVERGYEWGCQKIRFDSDCPMMRLCGIMSDLRARFRAVAFGDQGIFVTRELYDRIGGIPDMPIMEDYELSLKLKASEAKMKVTDSVITTSSRRFTDSGIVKTMLLMQKLQFSYRIGTPPEKIKEMYYDVR